MGRSTALVVTSDLNRASLWAGWLRRAGYMSLGCVGPGLTYDCPCLRGTRCALREAADVAIVDVGSHASAAMCRKVPDDGTTVLISGDGSGTASRARILDRLHASREGAVVDVAVATPRCGTGRGVRLREDDEGTETRNAELGRPAGAPIETLPPTFGREAPRRRLHPSQGAHTGRGQGRRAPLTQTLVPGSLPEASRTQRQLPDAPTSWGTAYEPATPGRPTKALQPLSKPTSLPRRSLEEGRVR